MADVNLLTSTVIAAAVSAGVSLIVAIVVNNKQYRNEYYKRVIDKRIAAVEAVEGLLAFFSNSTIIVDKGEEEFFTFLIPYDSDNDAFSRAAEIIAQRNIWLSIASAQISNQIVNTVGRLRYNVAKIKDLDGKIEYCIKAHPEFLRLKLALQQSIAKEMIKLFDIKAFLKERQGEANQN